MMKTLTVLFALFIVAVLVSAPAQAQATRTWVSGVGDDANPCSRTAPCKTFAGAISKTATDGEISVLDPGGFGAVTITKGITISGDGTLAGILNSLTNGIIVNAPSTANVIIRNISIAAPGNGLNGIRFLAGKSLTVDNVTISGFTGRGIDATLTGSGALIVRDTRITFGATGIFLSSTGLGLASLDNVSLTNLTNGLEVGGNGRVTVTDSVISNNASNGILTSAGTAVINVENSQIAFDALVGVNCATNGATIRLANNAIYNNTSGFTVTGTCIINSDGKNRIFGNGSNTGSFGGGITLQ